MRMSQMASRYARALFQIAEETGAETIIFSELKSLAGAMTSDPTARTFLETPLVQSSEKESSLQAMFQKVKASDLVKNFVLLLARKGRLPLLNEVCIAYQTQMDQQAGVVRGTVRTADDLSDARQDEVTKLLSKLTNQKVILDFEKDETITGGLTAQVGSLTIDDSVRSHLVRMQDELNRRTH